MIKRFQLFVIVIVLISIFIVGMIGVFIMSQYADQANEQFLRSANDLFAKEVGRGISYEDASATCLQIFGNTTDDFRITVVASDGTVLYDSIENATEMDNHLDRAEISDAIESKSVAVQKRYSRTIGADMLYLAIYHPETDTVIRSSIQLTVSQQSIQRMQYVFVAIMAAAVVVIGTFGYFFSKRLSRPLFELKKAAETVSASDYTFRINATSKDDIGAVSAAFNRMAEKLELEKHTLEANNERLADLQNMRSEFVANVSHELKTPLTSIRGFVDTLRNSENVDPAVQKRFLEIIDIEAQRLHQLINDILQLSEIERLQPDAEKEHFELCDLISETAILLKEKSEERGITIVFDACEDLPVLADRYRIKQILINLIDNAINYNRKDGMIWLSAKREPNSVIAIHVRDSGEGIPPEHLQRIFERFYRVDKSHSREVGGTGLGLSIVKHIAALYEGNAIAESQEGVGSLFIVRLKIADDLL
jgi:signal transduction histidine kinase